MPQLLRCIIQGQQYDCDLYLATVVMVIRSTVNRHTGFTHNFDLRMCEIIPRRVYFKTIMELDISAKEEYIILLYLLLHLIVPVLILLNHSILLLILGCYVLYLWCHVCTCCDKYMTINI